MLLNPAFQDAGASAGEALHWTLRSACHAQRIAGFGPSPQRAEEDFERWVVFKEAFAQGDLAMGMFDLAPEGVEDFDDGWNYGPLIVELSGGMGDPFLFAGSDFEDMESGWLQSPFASDWSEISSIQGSFSASHTETFDWYASSPSAWAAASFDGLGHTYDDFAGSWPAMHTL